MGNQSIASVVKFLLEAAWWILAVVLTLLLIVAACSFFIDIGGPNVTMSLPVAIEVTGPLTDVEAAGASNAQLENLRGNLRFPARKGVFFSGSMAAITILLVNVFWMVTQLRHVFRSLSRRSPFIPENARRIRWVGSAVIIAELGRAALVYYWSYYTSLNFTMSGVRFTASADVNATLIVVGLAIIAIAEVFQEGARLQQEQSLTI
ncbi:MAG TPA: DUF2975 domain-containing protein [Bryobacteraceae bacterium]|nr:DUF2975 domain-containing protein [Bryobacteraceae bacterium]